MNLQKWRGYIFPNMVSVKRYTNNPVLMPDKRNIWEAYAVLNGSIVKASDIYHLLYRAISEPQQWQDAHMRVSSIGHAFSGDGLHFDNRTQFIVPEYEWEMYGCEDPRVVFIDGAYVIFYTAISTNPPSQDGIRVGVAITKDFSWIEEKHLVTPFNAKAMVFFPEKINGKYTALLTVDTDNPPAKVAIAQFDQLSDLWQREYWGEWYANVSTHTLAIQRRSEDQVETGLAPIKTDKGWVVVYSYIQNYFSPHKVFGIEAFLLDQNNLLSILAKTNGPFMVPQAYPEIFGTIPNIIFPSGGIVEGDTLRIYYGASDTAICAADVSVSQLITEMLSDEKQIPIESVHSGLHLVRFEGNPILSPIRQHSWEESAVFNAAAFIHDNSISIVYRAMNDAFVSVFGLATTHDGFHIDKRFDEPIYIPRADFEINPDGGAAGCEDPRITQIGDMLYMHYTAYDGKVPRVARTSISLNDFLSRKWNWEQPQVISGPSAMDKNSILFPEKFYGKYAILHRLDLRIWIDFVEDFSQLGEGKKWLGGKVLMAPRPNMWDSEKIGSAGPPMKTEFGWLLIYHAISQRDEKYRLGIVVLDLKNPAKVIFRLNNPILEPKIHYETQGIRPGAVFSCGSVVLNDTLFVYYGAGDSVLCVAQIQYSELLSRTEEMMEHERENGTTFQTH